MHIYRIFLCVLLLFASLQSFSAYAEETSTFEDRIPKDILNKEYQFFTLTVENDFFGGGTDQQYTNGVRLTYFDMGSSPPLMAKYMDEMVPMFDIGETTSVYYSVGQNLYTPDDISAAIPDPNDRPYAGFLYGAVGMSNLDDNHIDDLELTLGIVGPWALGEETQEVVHDTFDFVDPSGWDHQLENEPGIILSWQRRWPEAYFSEWPLLHFRASPHVGVSLGNVYTYAATGVTFQLTPKQYRWQSQPLRIRPALPGSGFFAVPEDKFAWSLFAGGEGRAVGQNIFLDGNTFRDSPSVDKKHFVADLNAGVSMTYGKNQISYTLNWRSKEFDTQQEDAIFGVVSIGRRF